MTNILLVWNREVVALTIVTKYRYQMCCFAALYVLCHVNNHDRDFVKELLIFLVSLLAWKFGIEDEKDKKEDVEMEGEEEDGHSKRSRLRPTQLPASLCVK